MSIEEKLDTFIAFFERLEGHRLVLLGKCYNKNARFTDPLNDVEGLDRIRYVLEKKFCVEKPKYKAVHKAVLPDGISALIRWDFLYSVKGKRKTISGVSELTFNKKGEVIAQVDYWNPLPDFYERLPLSGRFIKSLKKKFSAV